MTRTPESLSDISASLPEDIRDGFERNVLSDAETLAAEIRGEAMERSEEAMTGLREIEHGEFLTMPELRERLDALKADIRIP